MSWVVISPEAMRRRPEAPYARLLRDAGLQIRYPDNPLLARGVLSEEETIAELRGAAAVLAGGERYTRRVLEALPELRVIARAGVGYDRVDVAAATELGVAVAITPTANHEAVAELALALLLAVAKRIVVNDRAVRRGGWPRDLPLALRGKTAGVLGLGRIGRSFAIRAAALGMTVIACDPAADAAFAAAHGIELVCWDDLLARSDVVTIHCPLTDATRNLIDRAALGKMKRGAVLINTARGAVVDEEGLAEALRSGRLAGAGLDVFRQEPPPPDHPLLQLDNVVVSPHIAGTDEVSSEAMGVEAAECIVRLGRGEWPAEAIVNGEVAARWRRW